MCGIFGVLARVGSEFSTADIEATSDRLFKLSESRGKEASGAVICSPREITVYKASIPASVLIRSRGYRNLVRRCLADTPKEGGPIKTQGICGHSRLVTNGAGEINANNQPVVRAGMVALHNGIVVNDDAIWADNPELKRTSEIDTEALLALIQKHRATGQSFAESVQLAFADIIGSASVAVLDQHGQFLLATNTGSLYFCMNIDRDALVFASEKYILKVLISEASLRTRFRVDEIQRVNPGQAELIDLLDLKVHSFSLQTDSDVPIAIRTSGVTPVDVSDLSPTEKRNVSAKAYGRGTNYSLEAPRFYNGPQAGEDPVAHVRRCKKCILPETMPLIDFDEEGLCNFCRHYVLENSRIKGEDALRALVEPFRSKNGDPDCIVAVSGGRDSCFGVHYLKTELGMNPLAYTYDWGMVTDIARRNQAIVLGKLGIEHILVSADIKRKRENIGRNLNAWLKRPALGMIPILMAGDKQFYYHARKLQQKTGTKLVFYCMGTEMERTNFKTGFCGLREGTTRDPLQMSPMNTARLFGYYAKEFLLNPAYVNRSVLDTLHAYYSAYVMPRNALCLFHYVKWNEERLMQPLFNEYDWEVAKDTTTTWRIGDGTAAFYNYVYWRVAGFSENDTFRSNQIREGDITRQQAMELIKSENQPRWPTIAEYLDMVGVDFKHAVQVVESIPKLYEERSLARRRKQIRTFDDTGLKAAG